MSKARLLPGSVYPAELGLTGMTVVVPAEETSGKVRAIVAKPTVPALVVTFEPADVVVFDPGWKARNSGPLFPLARPIPEAKTVGVLFPALNSRISPGSVKAISATNRLPAASKANPRR